jgi:hypothetical protein
MIYTTISGETCIARVLDRYNIKTNDWIPRCNDWIVSALRKMRLYSSYEICYTELPFENYRFKLPCELLILDAVVYDGHRLNVNNSIGAFNHDKLMTSEGSITLRAINTTVPVDDGIQYVPIDEEYLTLPFSNTIEYTPNHHGWIHLSNVESGLVTIYYRRLPVEYSEDYKIWFPKIPDKEEVLECIDWYVLTKILSRGYKHEVYSLTSAQQMLNPDIRFNETLKSARSAAKAISSDTRRLITSYLTTFLHNPNINKNYLINR